MPQWSGMGESQRDWVVGCSGDQDPRQYDYVVVSRGLTMVVPHARIAAAVAGLVQYQQVTLGGAGFVFLPAGG
jgi:hypothetical protein